MRHHQKVKISHLAALTGFRLVGYNKNAVRVCDDWYADIVIFRMRTSFLTFPILAGVFIEIFLYHFLLLLDCPSSHSQY